MTRVTGPDCAVVCSLINIHTYIELQVYYCNYNYCRILLLLCTLHITICETCSVQVLRTKCNFSIFHAVQQLKTYKDAQR